PGYIYPNFGYAPEAETRASPSPYVTDTTYPYLTPVSDRPVTQYSLPEYSEIYDAPHQQNE
ncbi:hypothetical protein ElyMa_003713100, partial [Elysia marginata]